MIEDVEIVRIAAKGDGATSDGRHFAGTVPGDRVLDDGTVQPGPHHIVPPCRHFGSCGGCELQHADDVVLSRFVTERVAYAAQGQGLTPVVMEPAHLSPPYSRRRATLHAVNGGAGPLIGFREAKSHRLIGLQECHILAPELFAQVGPLRALLARRKGKYAIDITLTLTDQGVDVGIKGLTVEGLAETEGLLDFARERNLARLTLDMGYGPEAMWEPEPVTVSLADVPVGFPTGAFLQATADGEAALAASARAWLTGARTIADLFSGLGTFAFALAEPTKVLAVEAAQDAHLACKAAASRLQKPVHAMHRDLFRNPLQPDELNRFDAVLLDPPRAGAREQVKLLAESTVERIVYVSCNPISWARDAAILAGGGYQLAQLRPVGQFRWSTHVELVSLFVRSTPQ
ncbi:putative RNA methyltransferase [Caenibius tardaugens NBRC 16725]|uniref:Putative RNA methyltransferase n=1 Tax=Caenibius tardaugens NBRC 16725 TaxID=1219035 RepID=U2YIQ1_9SPHN|nr:class I SAM-dependent RNA methyltransferase [Caenibius tardaugens]AZI38019.1 class I SAM-dependent RNA methyltransferase [Caenibius tardaugens NBRC 16725]GAD47997.1 putative RNA methyltransferase [Caenibius tardaugens NBRC 16725]